MDIIFNPPENNENQYIHMLVGQLQARGYRVHALDDFLSKGWPHFRSVKLVHLNWFENVDDSGFWVALRSFLRKMFVLTIIHLSAKKLVWTMHNRASHEKGLSFFSRTITRFLLHWSDRIVIHSHQTKKLLAAQYPKAATKTVYIPHPNFIGVYRAATAATAMPENLQLGKSPLLSLLFTGMVKPYKNLELLIQVVSNFPETVQLTIAGKAVDTAYQQQLELLASGLPNVRLVLEFVPDEALQRLIGLCDALVLPYDLASSLNSGTAILAFSCKKTVICPEIGTIEDLGDKQDLVFHYQYGNPAEHALALRQQISRAAALKKEDPEALSARGVFLFDYVKTNHSQEEAGRLLDQLYCSLTDQQL